MEVYVGSCVRTFERFLLECGELSSLHVLFVVSWLADFCNWSGIVRVLSQSIILHHSSHRSARLEYAHAMLGRLGVSAIVLLTIADAGHSRHVLIADGSLAGRNLPESILPQLTGRRKVMIISYNGPILLVFAHNSVAARRPLLCEVHDGVIVDIQEVGAVNDARADRAERLVGTTAQRVTEALVYFARHRLTRLDSPALALIDRCVRFESVGRH